MRDDYLSTLCALLLLSVAVCGAPFPAGPTFVSCKTSMCDGSNATFINDTCTQVDLTGQLGKCVQPYGEGFGFVRVYCDLTKGLVYTADYVSDPMCSPANMREVGVFKMDTCVQSNILHCDGEHLLPPDFIANVSLPYVIFKHCDTSDCTGDSCATVYHVPDVCNRDLYSSRSSFVHSCEEPPGASNQFAELLYTNLSDLTCSTMNYVQIIHTTGECVIREDLTQRYLGKYVQYECSEPDVIAAADPLMAPTALATTFLGVALLYAQAAM